jgi:hypothetical protein
MTTSNANERIDSLATSWPGIVPAMHVFDPGYHRALRFFFSGLGCSTSGSGTGLAP